MGSGGWGGGGWESVAVNLWNFTNLNAIQLRTESGKNNHVLTFIKLLSSPSVC